YEEVVGATVKIELIEQSIKILKESDIPYEFRTTVVKGLLDKEDIIKIADWIKGADHYCLQQFVSTEKTLDPDYKDRKAHLPEALHEMMVAIADKFKKVSIRGI
ncbi:MAG: anaerobic ribonucleoside-triphosphate reductase activating protein, partial [Candidatus Woesearchaeota archaeon]